MKALALVCALIAAAIMPAFSEVKDPAGFVGIKWGTPSKEAVEMLSKRPGVTFHADPDPDLLKNESYSHYFTGGKFAGIEPKEWTLYFKSGKLISAEVNFDCDDTLHDQFKKALSNKYGSGETIVQTRAGNPGDVFSALVTRWRVGGTSILCESRRGEVTITYAMTTVIPTEGLSDL